MQILLIVLAVVVVLILIDLAVFVSLSRRRRTVDTAWADLEQVLARRRQVSAQLVDAAEGVAAGEPTTLQAVRNANQAVDAADTPQEHAEAHHLLSGALASLAGLAASYPDLAADATATDLNADLDRIDTELELATTSYAEAVTDYNAKVTTPPTSAVARRFGFTTREHFTVPGATPATEAAES